MPKTSVELNGFKLFTVDYAAKHIGKPIVLYCCEYKDTWPKKNAWSKPQDSTFMKYTFVPNGGAIKEKTKIDGWLKSRVPAIKKGTHFYIDGPLYECNKRKCDDYLADGIQVDSFSGKVITVDLLSTETFVKV